MNEYKLEMGENGIVVARIYIEGVKTSAFTTIIPKFLKKEADELQEEEDMKPF